MSEWSGEREEVWARKGERKGKRPAGARKSRNQISRQRATRRKERKEDK